MSSNSDKSAEEIAGVHLARSRARTFETLTVCDKIAPDRAKPEMSRYELSVADRWNALTQPLPLKGGPAMSPVADGSLPRLDALAAAAPWAAGLVADAERQVRMQLALGRPWMRIEPTLLVGPPGTGKTWIARRLADAVGLAHATLEMGGVTDDRLLAGTARGYANTIPAWPLIVIADTMTANPVLILDELEKAGGSARFGRPHYALLSMLEPASAKAWYDQSLLTVCDISRVSWIACCNSVGPLPAPLLSRFHIHELPRPGAEHFDAALASVTASLADDWSLAPDLLPPLPARALKLLREDFAVTGSVRRLARHARAMLGAALADGRGGPPRH